MSKNFIITSCIKEPFVDFKQELLFRLTRNIKTLIKDSFVIIVEANELQERCQRFVDFAVVDRYNPDDHILVNGEISNLYLGLKILKSLNKDWYYKISYDFIIDSQNYHIFNNWKKKASENPETSFVGSAWCNMQYEPKPAIGAWSWYSTVDFTYKMLPSSQLRNLIEYEMFANIHNAGLISKCFFYPCANALFDGTWERCGDIINGGGKEIKDKKSFERFID